MVRSIKIVIFFIASVTLFVSCKKEPKKGYWNIVINDESGASIGAFNAGLKKDKDVIYLISESTDPRTRISGDIYFNGDQITNGEATYSNSGFSGHAGTSTYYANFSGKRDDRKNISGTCTYHYIKNDEYSTPGDDSIDKTGNATFTIKWISRKIPDSNN